MASIETMVQLLSPYPPGWGGTLLKGAVSTLAISAGAYLIGILIGMAGALGKLSGNRPLGMVLSFYTTMIRAVSGTIDRAGADHLDLALHDIDEPRRSASVRGYRLVPFAALSWVRWEGADVL